MNKTNKEFHKEVRFGDDYRLPTSLLSEEEYLEAVRLLDLATKQPMDRCAMSEPTSRYHELYLYLKKIYDRFQANDFTKERCVVCGRQVQESPNPKPLCRKCIQRIRFNEFCNTQNTRGYRNWGRFCIVCHEKPADPNRNGMCYSCYRIGDKLGTHDPEEIKKKKRMPKKKAILRPEMTHSISLKEKRVIEDHLKTYK